MPDPVINKGILYVVSAPSGAGKTTLIKSMLTCFKNLLYSVSHTTRTPRKNELHGVDYFFITREEFQKKIKHEHFLEWAKVHEHYYGTSKNHVTANLNQGKSLILDIDVQGAQKIMQSGLNIVSIFIMPPSIKVLSQRLKKRGTDSIKVIKTRLDNVKREIDQKDLYQFVVINDDLEQAKNDFYNILKLPCGRS